MSINHELYMKRALALAARARGRTSPNPMVGAVLVKNGRIRAEDYHRAAGTPHAEALVIGKAGKLARGATLYITLEPCCHTDKRTSPCASSIIKAGIKRVFTAMQDPNPKVSGRGIAGLRAAGIKVTTDMLKDKARVLNEAYVKFITKKRPFVTLKVAMTLDGKIATPTGQSKWITGQKARRLVHKMRSHCDAVLTAAGTVKADDPQFTSRTKGGRDPLRVVIDPRLETPPGARILATPPQTLLVAKANNKKAARFKMPGVQVLTYEKDLSLDWLMKVLAQRGVMSVLIEGGSSLAWHALEEEIVDKVVFFVAPKIIGGLNSYPAVGGRTFRTLENAHGIEGLKARRIGEDLVLEGYLKQHG